MQECPILREVHEEKEQETAGGEAFHHTFLSIEFIVQSFSKPWSSKILSIFSKGAYQISSEAAEVFFVFIFWRLPFLDSLSEKL